MLFVERALDALIGSLDTDLFEIADDDLNGVFIGRSLLCGAFNDEADGFAAAIGVDAETVAVLVGVAGVIQQLVGAVGIVFDVGVSLLGIGLGRLFERAVLSRCVKPFESQFVERISVHGERHGNAHVAVLEKLAQAGLLYGLIGCQANVLVAGTELHPIAAVVFAFLVKGEVSCTDVALLEVDVAVNDAQVEYIVGVKQAVADGVNVRELIAVRIDLPEVWISLHEEEFFRQWVLGGK